MWTNSPLGDEILLAVTAPVNDPAVVDVSLSRSGAAFVGSLFLFMFFAFFGDRTWAIWARYIALGLGIGSWVITQEDVLQIGQALRTRAADAFAVVGLPELSGGVLFTVVVILAFAAAIQTYRKKRSMAAVLVMLLIAGVLFTGSYFRELALSYAENVGVPVAKLVLGFFGGI